MNQTTNRRLESLIYLSLWTLVIAVMVLDIMRARSYTEQPLLDFATVTHVILGLLPFVAMFVINNYLLIPKLLKRGYYKEYFLCAVLLIVVIWIWQRYQFFDFIAQGERREPPHNGPTPLLPLPLFLDLIYDLLILGVNLAIAMIFQHFADRMEQERLMKENAENQLTYLKAQINPHFYMNMLNNIHGMIEINPAKAQDMVIEMSGLMRYMLYESSRPAIQLGAEIKFIGDYLGLMRERYPADAVAISADMPSPNEVAGVEVAPLLFLVFIENAFKHGVSYSETSYISVNLAVEGGRIYFRCINSRHKADDNNQHRGIGFENVRRRLDLIYGSRYSLDINQTGEVYSVTLSLPIYETENCSH